MAQSRFIERTLLEINHSLEYSFFADRIARQKGFLQRFDPRAKMISLLFLLIAVGSARNLWIIAGIFFAALIAVPFSRFPLTNYFKRVCLLVAAFTSLIALPALFLTPGAPLWTLPGGLIITQSGAVTASFLILRVTTSISLATLFLLTTPWNDVLKALGLLRLPDVIVIILAMTYRYIHLLLHEAEDMFTARKSRLLKRLSPAQERQLLGNNGGVLLSKSLQLSGEVYLAMQSRGYHHYPRTLDQFKLRWRDAILLGFALAVMISVFIYS